MANSFIGVIRLLFLTHLRAARRAAATASAAAARVAALLRPSAYAPRPATSAASPAMSARPPSGAGAANLNVRRVGTARIEDRLKSVVVVRLDYAWTVAGNSAASANEGLNFG